MFRTGICPVVILECGGRRKMLHVKTPDMLTLKAGWKNHFGSLPSGFSVIRNGFHWNLTCGRDVEELVNQDLVTAAVDYETPCLRDFPLDRCMIPCVGPLILPVSPSTSILDIFRTHGFLKVRLSRDTLDLVNSVMTGAVSFFEQDQAYKNFFQGNVHGKLAPHLGYRSTELRKELLVYRKTVSRMEKLPPHFNKLPELLKHLGQVAMGIMADIFQELGRTQENVKEMLKEALEYTVSDSSELGMTSFIEVFKYDMNPSPLIPDFDGNEEKFRLVCGEHRDTGLLTLIPCATVPGLEVFNWSSSGWHLEEGNPEECIVFPGELFSWFTDTDVAALCHRVVIPLRKGSARYSCPMELLPSPSFVKPNGETMKSEMSRLAKGLVSTNH